MKLRNVKICNMHQQAIDNGFEKEMNRETHKQCPNSAHKEKSDEKREGAEEWSGGLRVRRLNQSGASVCRLLRLCRNI